MMSKSPLASICAKTLISRALAGGGFSMFPEGAYRPDSTAWGVLSLAATRSVSGDHDVVESGRSRLIENQLEDGRVSMSSSNPESYWPTPLAILAWHGSEKHAEPCSRATDFLLRTSGRHWVKENGSPLAHDTSIRGWPWTDNTHSWVVPTALSVLALRISGLGEHDRVHEGIRLLMDRQLPSGGWNFGNTLIFGKELYPQPDCTGLALSALSDAVSFVEVRKSASYLQSQAMQVRTPLSLGWSVLGLGAWGKRPGQATAWLSECMSRQERYGAYDTTLVSLLLLALEGKEGLLRLFV